jgi:hypothetical protein
VWVTSGAVASLAWMQRDMEIRTGLPPTVVAEVFRDWPMSLAAMCDGEGVEYLDLRGAWEAYLTASPRPRAWYQRDAVHANTRGKQILGRILAAYLGPRDRAGGTDWQAIRGTWACGADRVVGAAPPAQDGLCSPPRLRGACRRARVASGAHGLASHPRHPPPGVWILGCIALPHGYT